MSYRADKHFWSYLAMVKNPKIRSYDLGLWPVTLIFNTALEVVKPHVDAKLHPAKCSGWWVILLTEKKKQKNSTDDENYTAIDSAGRNNSLV